MAPNLIVLGLVYGRQEPLKRGSAWSSVGLVVGSACASFEGAILVNAARSVSPY